MIDHKSPITLEEINQKTVLENTFQYLENYLRPGKKWYREISPKERINHIRYAQVNWETVSNHIKGMDYPDFLRTPYWIAISTHKKFKAGFRCQVCNSSNHLVTHHRDYSIHGYEHAHMWELTVLCDDCHHKFHDQASEWKRHFKRTRKQESTIVRDDCLYASHDPLSKWWLLLISLFVIFLFLIIPFIFCEMHGN